MKKWLGASLLLNVALIAAGLWGSLVISEMVTSRIGENAQRLQTQFDALSPPPGTIVFVGDSITQGGRWAELFGNPSIVNRGIGGNTTTDLLGRIDTIHALDPRTLFLMIGINDLNVGLTRAETFANLGRLFDGFDRNLPDTEIYVQSVLPVNDQWWKEIDPADIEAINERLAAESTARGYRFVDLRPAFVDADGKLRPDLSNDGIHLLGAGYLAWREEFRRLGIDLGSSPREP